MSDLDTYNGTLLLASLELEERTEDPCEHPQHSTSENLHAGPGEWLVRVTGHGCAATVDSVRLYCDKYKRIAFDCAQLFRCSCGTRWRAEDAYTLLGRKGVDF